MPGPVAGESRLIIIGRIIRIQPSLARLLILVRDQLNDAAT